MNETTFNKELKNIATDLRLLWNPERHCWGIYQIRSPHILVFNADMNVRPMLLWDCKDAAGEPRLPDRRDLVQVMKSKIWHDELQRIGGDAYHNKILSQEEKRHEKKKAEVDDTLMQAAKEVSKSVKTVAKRGRAAWQTLPH